MKDGSAGKNFWAQIKKTSTCWPWMGSRNDKGYGHIQINKRHIYVHRFIWMWFNGAIPDGLEVCHKCDNPSCLNPKHLFLGSHADNMNDCARKGRNGNAKLTEWDIREIRRRTDMPVIALARAFMVGGRNIRELKARRTWKHVV